MTPERFQRICSVLKRRQPDLSVLLDNVHKPHNFSAIIRSCDAVGVLEAHGVWFDAKLRPTNHTSGGSRKWVQVRQHRSVAAALDVLRDKGHRIYAAHLSATALDYRDVDYTEPTTIVLGAELDGLSHQGIELADQHICIPIMGMVHSLNVSVAGAVILFEAQRQRQLAGFYKMCRLDDLTYERTLFEWLHPAVASYCQKKARRYPELDETGEIINFDCSEIRCPASTILSGRRQLSWPVGAD